jgi:hypothetical protein
VVLDEIEDLEISEDSRQMERHLISEIWEIYEILSEIFSDDDLVDLVVDLPQGNDETSRKKSELLLMKHICE